MTTTTLKHRTFIKQPMSDKPVTELAGIGSVYAQRLADIGCGKV
jgi:predicted flap endonuclease-1-like 5' DNA nuclease